MKDHVKSLRLYNDLVELNALTTQYVMFLNKAPNKDSIVQNIDKLYSIQKSLGTVSDTVSNMIKNVEDMMDIPKSIDKGDGPNSVA